MCSGRGGGKPLRLARLSRPILFPMKDKWDEDPVMASAGLMFSVCESKEALEACVNLLMKLAWVP